MSNIKQLKKIPTFNPLTIGDLTFLSVILIPLVILANYNFLLYHSITEVGITSISLLTFAFSWHLRRFDLGFLFILGILMGSNALLNVFHFLSYKGMGVFENDNGYATQLWIAGRYQISIVLLISPYLMKKSFSAKALLYGIFSSSLILIFLIFTGNFPECYNPLNGQTPFKIWSEYIISILLILSMLLFWKNIHKYQKKTGQLITLFFICSICAEIIFTTYFKLTDASNILGHILVFLSFYALYKAIIVTGLNNPFDLLFKNLNDAVKIRDEFISVASHELKTPLTPLKLQIQLLQRELTKSGTDSERLTKMTSITNKQIDRLTKLIDGMLDVSRFNSGRFNLNFEKIELSNLINEICTRHKDQIDEAHNKLTLKLHPTYVYADSLRIDQVFCNLIINATRYAPSSEIEIGIKEINSNEVMIWVSDTGPGISDEFRPRIFDQYASENVNPSHGGLGLGLYISHQIILAHGGNLYLDPDNKKGLKFIITLKTISQLEQ